nr:hypothetical protein [uncultured Duganella sp.]
MNKGFVRLVLACLLVVAIPLQGYATTLGICCLRMQQLTQAEQAAQQPCHDEAARAATVDGGGKPTVQHGHCKTCTCVIGVLAPPSAQGPAMPAMASSVARVATPKPVLSFIPSGLERPPKSLFVRLA